MERRTNPYTPNAGARPPVLVGRESELEEFDVLLHRLRAGYTEKSLIVVGLRGVGKTVLLGEFRELALQHDWNVVDIEVSKWDEAQFRRNIARELGRVLRHIKNKRKITAALSNAIGALRSFTLRIDPDGQITAGFDVDASMNVADSGDLDLDLSDLLVSVGEAAREHDTGVALLLDELHFLERPQMEALIAAVHKTVQRSLPITAAAAGLPQIHELVGEAKSYAERLFKFPSIGSLNDSDARKVLQEPARRLNVNFEDEALDVGLEFSEGYPYFLQEYGEAVWDIAAGPSINGTDGLRAKLVVQEKLDSGFFAVRLERATELQRAYLRAMAELGPDPQLASNVADLLERTSSECGPTRKQLIDKGLLYATEHGYAAFTVPGFDEYLKRAIPQLSPPPIRRRRGRSDRGPELEGPSQE